MKAILTIILAVACAGPTLAQVPESPVPLYFVPSPPARVEGMLREIPRAEAPSLDTAIQLAVAAVEACAAKGGKVSVLVTDSVATPVVMLSGDGASERSQLITSTKAHVVVMYGLPSGEVAEKARSDPDLARELALNPNIGVARGGAFPLKRDGELIGVLAVSGMRGEDEACAQEAMAKVPIS